MNELIISITALPILFGLLMLGAYLLKGSVIVKEQVDINASIPKINIKGVQGKRFERLSFETY